MTEVLHDQNEQRNARPIGRFLLGLEDYEGEHDPFAYAKEFASRPGNFQKHRHKSSKISKRHELVIDDRNVELEFSISRNAYIWKIIVAAERHKTEHLSTGYIPHGGEQYELHCAQPKSHGVYHEYGVQGMAIREREFDSKTILQKLQGVIERMISDEVEIA